jgi:hypothetical protein
MCQPLVRKTQEIGVRGAHAENVQSSQRFRTPQFSPALSISGLQPPLALQYTLWPGVIVSICGIKDVNGCTSANCVLQNHATSECFVVGMGRNQQQSRIRCEYWCKYRRVHSETRANVNQQIAILSHRR